MKITYYLCGIDDATDAQVVDVQLTADRVAVILTDILKDKLAEPKPLTALDKKREERMPVSGREKPAPRKCGQCGKTGHNAKTCPRKGTTAVLAPEADARSAFLTEDQFDDIKHLKSTGELSSLEYARENGVSLAEVNRAVMARNYQDYKRI